MSTKFIDFKTAVETAAEAEREKTIFKSRTVLAKSLSVGTNTG